MVDDRPVFSSEVSLERLGGRDGETLSEGELSQECLVTGSEVSSISEGKQTRCGRRGSILDRQEIIEGQRASKCGVDREIRQRLGLRSKIPQVDAKGPRWSAN